MSRTIKFRGPIQSEGASLGTNAVGTLEIEDGSVAAADLASNAVETAKIKDANVTYAKIQNVSATDKLLGRSTAGAGVVEEITCTAAGRALLDDEDAATQIATLGLGDLATKDTVAHADLDADAVESDNIKDAAVTSAKLANGAGIAALVTAGMGDSKVYVKTDAGAKTVLAANVAPAGDRAVLIVINVDETFADGTGTQTAFTFGETGSATKFADGTLLAGATAGDVFVLAGMLTEATALLATATAATGDGTGGISITVLALPKAA